MSPEQRHAAAERWLWEAELLTDPGPFWLAHVLAFFESMLRHIDLHPELAKRGDK